MLTIFMGTPDFAVPTLDALLNSKHNLVTVVTQPDRPKGRHLRLQASPVKIFARKKNLPILQPTSLDEKSFENSISSLNPEVIVVVAYGRIIPGWILSFPAYGCINVHASLLPKYRGAAPIQRAIMDGCTETGVTTMLLDEGMDTGDILLQSPIEIEPDDTSREVEKKLSQKGAELLLETLDGLAKDCIIPRKQDESEASYAPKIEKEEAFLEWSEPASRLRDLIRALNPFPGAYTYFRSKRLKVFRARIFEQTCSPRDEAGTLIGLENDGIIVASADKPLILTEIQLENKRKMTAAEFLRGHRVEIGEKLG